LKVSLILATINRTLEVQRFLEHLNGQSFRDVQLIMVDQNPDDRLVPILERFRQECDIIHIRTDVPGVSRARNMGIQYIQGDIVAFPDDDCWYPSRLLERVSQTMESNTRWHGISGRLIDDKGRPGQGGFDYRKGCITKHNIWRRVNTNTIFLRKAVVEAVGGFDESLGPAAGNHWGASEDVDFVLGALKKSFSLFYLPELEIGHPDPLAQYNDAAIVRAFTYGCGMGRVLEKHSYPGWYVIYYLIRPLGGYMLAIAQADLKRAKYHWNVFKGRWYGWWESRKLKGI